MNVSCTNCGKRYVLSDDKVAGKTSVKIRCRQCQTLLTVDVATGATSLGATSSAPGPAAHPSGGGRSSAAVALVSVQQPAPTSWDDETTRAMPAVDLSVQWHAMIGGAQQGPFDINTLAAKVAAGEVTLRTYLWKAGMADWKRAADVGEVSSLFAGVPPPRADQHAQPPVRRDVAVANETPSPEVTRRKGGNVADPLSANSPQGRALGNNELASISISRPSGIEPQPTPTPAQAPDALRSTDFDADPATKHDEQPGGAQALADNPPSSTDRQEALGEPQPTDEQQPLNNLFSDVSKPNLTATPSGVHESPNQEQGQQENADPFAALGEADEKDLPPPGETTKFFIAQAGVNKRNPPWKIALFVVSVLGLPTAVLYLLSTFKVIPPVTRTTEDGQVVQESFFSPGGIAGIRDVLTGDDKRRRLEAERREKERQAAILAVREREKKEAPKSAHVPDPVKPTGPDNIASLYELADEGKKEGKAPKNKLVLDLPPTSSGGLEEGVVSKVIGDNLKAFSLCIDNALRKDPNLKVGKVTVKLNVGPSGAVQGPGHLEPSIHEKTTWGECLTSTGRKIVFPSSDGETEVQIPLKLGVAM